MYDEQIEKLISLALADGVLTEKEKQILFKKAEVAGIDLDEFEMVLEAKLYERTEGKTPAPAAAPKSDKYGDVKKCPACGAIIASFSAKCTDCGTELRSTEANQSIEKLSHKLNEISDSESWSHEKREKKASVIKNFAVPNNREDLFEFMTMALSNLKGPKIIDEYGKEEQEAWSGKAEQILDKMKLSLPNDKQVAKYEERFLNYSKSATKYKQGKLIKKLVIWSVVVFAVCWLFKGCF